MADISSQPQGPGKKRSGKVRAKKHPIKIDMTPMVDLAFLLLTFFILTATLTKSNVMDVQMRDEADHSDNQERINERDVLHIVLGEKNRVAWWMGNDEPAYTDYSTTGLRDILIKKRQQNPKMFILIKPMENSVYQNMVDVLDELQIASDNRFTIVDYTDEDEQKVSATFAGAE